MEAKTFENEKKYLEDTLNQLDKNKNIYSKKVKENKQKIKEFKQYFADNYYDIRTGKGDEFVGEDEFAHINISIENLEKQNDSFEKDILRFSKQKKNPYFGRFDFKSNEDNDCSQFYIGLGSIQSDKNQNIVYDWRADICSLYYDDKIGKTSYTCQDGEISGDLSLKRQFKIEDGKLNYYIDSNLIIDDEILMEQLSKNTTNKMHDIVSTIQKEQNVLIRDDDFENTIVQGVAGSGKTSIAMHRISYLLYKYRKQLKSEDILVLSPSEVFSEYINEVLPSLGEEKSYTITFYDIAKRNLHLPFETRETMLSRVIGQQKQSDFENIAIKSSFEFLIALQNFLKNDICNLFVPKTIMFGNLTITKDEIKDIFFNRLKNISIHKRIEVIADFIVDRFRVPDELKKNLTKRAEKILYSKFLTTDLIKIYNIFLRSIDLDEIESIGSYDIAPILLIKENLFSLSNNYDAKYVIVDEMQDYTPCHFYLFEKIWNCPKLYLGDIYQSIDRTLQANYLDNLAKLTNSKLKFLTKSYRSTLQISTFAQKILGKHIADNVNRNGDDVKFIKTNDCTSEIEKIIEEILSNKEKSQQSIAIICKTHSQIVKLQKESGIIKSFALFDSNSISSSKHIITTPAEAKGVEFDCVIVPFVDEQTYKNELDKNLLYVSATRALHNLYFLTDKKASKFLIKHKK